MNCRISMKILEVGLLVVFYSTFLVICYGIESDILVQTQQGSIRGTILTSQRSNRSFFAFMGIPYAKPPVGDLRFKAPQPPEPWSGIRNATKEGNVCPQVNEFKRTFEGTEDCLFLNVYSEKLPTGQNQTLRPVMFSIHGGGYWFGSGNRDAQGPDFLIDHGVVVVTINYRLGFLGFLSLQSAEVAGNYGLKDQVMALRWVQQNIAQFGGDPNNVTIFGVSAGGACVSLLMLSPMSQGLFHRAISQSGTALNSWSISSPEGSLRLAKEAAEILEISTNNTQVLWQALVNASLIDLWPVIRAVSEFRPTVDAMAPEGEVFLPDTPRRLLNGGQVRKIPYIAGLTSNEGIVLLKALDRSPSVLLLLLDGLISESLDIEMNATSKQEVLTKIKNFYYGTPDGTNTTVQQSIHLITDMMFLNGIYCIVRKQAESSSSPVYMYEFSFSGNMNVFKKFYGGQHLSGDHLFRSMDFLRGTNFENTKAVEVGLAEFFASKTSNRYLRGIMNLAERLLKSTNSDGLYFQEQLISCASHADDLAHIYHTTFHNQSFIPNTPEYITSERMVTLWTNFAKYGNPTPEAHDLLQNVTWTPVTSTNFSFLNIDQDLIVEHEIRREALNFWQNIYSNYTSFSLCG